MATPGKSEIRRADMANESATDLVDVVNDIAQHVEDIENQNKQFNILNKKEENLCLKKIEEQNDQILKRIDDHINILQKKKVKKVDENEERGNWSGQFEFFLSCLGYAVGLGNVWRFPYLCYRNGGGAFLIPYVIMLVFLGMPIFFLELNIGQFSSHGLLTCWEFSPIFSGLGYGMLIVTCILALYYNIIIGWSIYYLFDSFRSKLPWETCDPAWSTSNCMDNLPLMSREECLNDNYVVNATAGICTNGTKMAIFNKTLAKTFGIVRVLPSEEYLERHVLGSAYSDGIGDLGPIRTPIILCYFVAFILVVISLSKSIKSSGKVVYFTAIFPYAVLFILFVKGLTLEGYEKGLEFYTVPDLSRLTDSGVWKDAAVQIFFSLSASYGGIITLSTYSRFHTNTLRDMFAVTIGNCLTSVFAGFVIFFYLGNLATIMDVPVSEVAKDGPTLTFVVYPFAVTKLPGAPFWAILFFIMLITLGVDSQFVLVETLTTSLSDRFPKLREHKLLTVSVCCLIMFVLGLTMTTNGGIYMLTMLDSYSGGWTILIIALLECIAIGYVYGAFRFAKDIECMIGKKVFGESVPWRIVQYWWVACWCVFTPIGLVFILIYSWVDYKSLAANGFPVFADALGWLLTLTVLGSIAGKAIFLIMRTPGTFMQRIKVLSSSSKEWGPALRKHRELVAEYDHNIHLEPFEESEMKSNGIPNIELGTVGQTNEGFEKE